MKGIEIPHIINFSITCIAEMIVFIVWRNTLSLVLAIFFAIIVVGLIVIHLLFKNGEERETPLPATLAWISKGLRKYLDQDEFGVYKKENTKIPFIYKLEYANNKKHREFMINYHYARLENITDLDRIEKEKLLRMG